jgi:hypothetical protein
MDLTFSSEDEWENELPLAQRVAMKMGQTIPVQPTSLLQGQPFKGTVSRDEYFSVYALKVFKVFRELFTSLYNY